MTEEDKYSQLEDDLIRLNYALSQTLTWWQRLFKRPSKELTSAIDDVHRSLGLMHAHLEFCKVANKDRCIKLLRKTEQVFSNTLRKYKALNKWNYQLYQAR